MASKVIEFKYPPPNVFCEVDCGIPITLVDSQEWTTERATVPPFETNLFFASSPWDGEKEFEVEIEGITLFLKPPKGTRQGTVIEFPFPALERIPLVTTPKLPGTKIVEIWRVIFTKTLEELAFRAVQIGANAVVSVGFGANPHIHKDDLRSPIYGTPVLLKRK